MRAARVDDNHVAVVEALRKAGAMVQSLAAVGDGVPDLLIGKFFQTLSGRPKWTTRIITLRFAI